MNRIPDLSIELGDQLELALDLFGFESKKVGGFYSITEAAVLTGKPRQRIGEAIRDGRLPLVEFRFTQGGKEGRLGPFVAGESIRRFLSEYRPAKRPRKGETAALLARLSGS